MKILVNEKLSEHKYKTPEGYLICVDSILARTGKQTYRRDELFQDGDSTEIEVDRLEDEVFAKETLASFENKPITVEHPDENVNAENYKDYSVGFVRDVHRGDFNGEPVILGTLVITDAQTIKEIEDGEHTELSCGYDCDIEDEEHPQQKNIRGNHVALCQRGRAGIAKIVDSIDDETYRKGKPKKYRQFTLYERADDRRDYITEDDRLLKRYEYYKNGKTYSIIWKVNNKFYKDLYDAIYESNPISINNDWLSRSGEVNAKNTTTIVLEKDAVNDAFKGPGTYVVNGGKDGTFDISSKEMYEKCLKENPDIKTLERRKVYSHGDFGKFSGKYWNDSINDDDIIPKMIEYLGLRSHAFGYSDDKTAREELTKKFPNADERDIERVIKRWHTGKWDDSINDGNRLSKENRKFIANYLRMISTFTNRDIDIKDILRPLSGHGFNWTIEKIDGWKWKNGEMAYKDYYISIDGYDDTFLVTLYADPNQDWKVKEVNAYFTDSINDEQYSSHGLTFEIKKVVNNKEINWEIYYKGKFITSCDEYDGGYKSVINKFKIDNITKYNVVDIKSKRILNTFDREIEAKELISTLEKDIREVGKYKIEKVVKKKIDGVICDSETDVEDEPMIYLNYLNKLNKAETKEKRNEILENAKRSVLEEKLQQKDYERLASHFNDAAYTLSGYDKISLLKEDIKKAKRRGLEAWMENSDGERQLFVRGDAKKLKDYVDNYLGLDSSGITDSIEDTPVPEEDIDKVDTVNYVVGKNGVWFAKAKNESQLLTLAYCSADKGKTWHKCYLETKSDAPSGRTQAGKMFFRTSANFPGPRTSIGRNILTWYANNGVHKINETLEIDHVNGKYTDDRLSNLERVTRNENIRRMQMNLRRNDSINNKLVKIIRAIDAKRELTFSEYIEKMYGISANDLSDDDYDGLYEEWLNEKPYWTKDKSKIHKAKQSDSVKDINIEELPRKRQIHIFCEEFMNKNGLNNSIGKYDKAIQATKNLLGEGFLTGDKLKESTIREFKRMLKKYNSDDDKVKTL